MIASVQAPRLSTREKAAQVVMVDFRFDAPDYDRLTTLVRQGVGGVILFGGSIFDVAPLVNSLQRIARVPLLIASDYEHGVGHQVRGATVLPTNMAVGASGSEELAELKGRVTGTEARALGVPWVLAPVVDLQSNPRNPIVNVRSFGESPELVTRMARAFLRGVRSAGALSCLKHFPGHGDVEQDSHLVLPRVRRSREQMRAQDLRPFAALASEADAVMTAHLLVEAFDSERPASLSRALTSRLLRHEMGFGGLVCTDALIMGGVTGLPDRRKTLVDALVAEADILLYPEDAREAIDHVTACVADGTLDEEVLDRAVERIWVMKRKAGLPENPIVDVEALEGIVGSDAHREAARRIAEAAVTRVFDRGETLPLRGAVRHVAMVDPGTPGDPDLFRRELERRGKIDPASDVAVLSIYSKVQAFSGRSGPDPERLRAARAQLGNAKKIVVASFGSPYAGAAIPEAAAFVCAYGEDEASQAAAARALCGEIPFSGKLPVTL